MKDIETRNDIALLMREFYNRLLADPAISYIFTDVAKIGLEAHLPHLTDFWELSVLHTGTYKKNVMQLHLDLNSKEKLTDTHFDVWLGHFNQSVDDLFSGSNAEKIKTRALSIATIMKIKIHTT
ncbi:group III truncated hemoglobin [Flavobacterium sp. ST-75]|uniref:Group III truncated hemoglobin n=1 Tax=Flavobacterium rhizophilum TaxID=3163296 RepID=A0ABW8Y9R5_9FLAO